MLGTDFMPTQITQIGHSGMGTQKSLRRPNSFESPVSAQFFFYKFAIFITIF